MTSLLQPATPGWFRLPLSSYLSTLAIRPQGVKHLIEFIADNAPEHPSVHSGGPDIQSSGPSLSLEVLSQASKLLSSVPSSMTADAYFASLGPQILRLLDNKNLDERRAAAYIIGNGILGRRRYGFPGTVGWKVFAEPIMSSFNPVKTMKPTSRWLDSDENGLEPAITSELLLEVSLERLVSLMLFHPNPGLAKRLISPCIQSLWSLLCYSKEINRSTWVDKVGQILRTYFQASVGIQQLISLSDNILRDGESWWTYAPGPYGGIEIRKRSEDASRTHKLMQTIDGRVEEFIKLLKVEVADDHDIGALFVHVSKHWLLDGKGKLDATENDPLHSLVYAKLTQKMLEEYKDKLAGTPKSIIELLNQLLAAHAIEREELETWQRKSSKPSLAGLGAITHGGMENSANMNVPDGLHDKASTEIVSIALSLLTAIISSPEFSLDPQLFKLLGALRTNLKHLTTSGNPFPTSLIMTATNILAILDFHTSLPPPTLETSSRHPDPHAADRKSHHQALTHLTDPLPPIRAQGLSTLTTLIGKLSPILDIPSTTILLQSLLQDDDEFIYLSAIKALGLLASRHPKTVLKRLVEQYIDPDETSGLDVRIRVGETLLKTVEQLGAALVGDAAVLVGEGMITVAGRRGKKPKAAESRRRKAQQAERAKREADEAWGGEAPSSERPEEEQDAHDNDEEEMLQAWNTPAGEEDDIRIRFSALSILGVAIETDIAALGSSRISTAIDLVLSILKLETAPAAAILRRAAVLVLMSVLKALDTAEERAQRLGFGLAGEGLGEVLHVLRVVEGREGDGVVVGHVRAVVERLERWRTKMLVGGGRGRELGLGLGGGGLAGLSMNPGDNGVGGRPRIEEVE